MFSLRTFTTVSNFSQAGEMKKSIVSQLFFVLIELLQVSLRQGIIYI